MLCAPPFILELTELAWRGCSAPRVAAQDPGLQVAASLSLRHVSRCASLVPVPAEGASAAGLLAPRLRRPIRPAAGCCVFWIN